MDILQLMPRPKNQNHVLAAHRRWGDPDYRRRVIETKRKTSSEHMKRMRATAFTQEAQEKRARKLRMAWKTDDMRNRYMKNRWSDEQREAARQRMIERNRKLKEAA